MYRKGVLLGLAAPSVPTGPEFFSGIREERIPLRRIFVYNSMDENPSNHEICMTYLMLKDRYKLDFTSEITCYKLNGRDWKVSRGPLTVEKYVDKIFQSSGSEFVFGFGQRTCFKFDSKQMKLLSSKPFLEFSKSYLDSPISVIVILGFSIYRFDEETESLVDTNEVISESFSLSAKDQVCHQFTDSRRRTLGGRCITSNRELSVVTDFNSLDWAAEGRLVNNTRYIWAPTFPLFGDYNFSNFYTRIYYFTDFDDDIGLISYSIKEASDIIFLYDLGNNSLFPII